jgi:hypothetical protein
VVTGLTPSTAYVFRAAFVNSQGAGAWSEEVTITTADATVPQAPTVLTQTELWSTNALLRWEGPVDNGGSDISGYVVGITGVTDPGFARTIDVAPPVPGSAPPESVLVDGLVATHEYDVTVRAANEVGAGAATPALEIYTYLGGQCAGDPPTAPGGFNDATVFNDNLAQFSDAMATACGGCLGFRACFVGGAWQDLFSPTYTDQCTGCWGDTCACSTANCLIPCLGGDQAACDQCVIDNCNPTTQACTGVPRNFIPRG